jgi:hypothetical protein
MMMRVHVTLEKTLLGKAEALARLRDRVVAVSAMRDIDEKRLQRYGVLSGTIDEGKVQALQHVDGVVAVEPDELRYAIGGEGPA